jgi:hypothetical protein
VQARLSTLFTKNSAVRDGFTSTRGSNELLKQALRERVIRHAFWMPLDTYNPVWTAGPFYGFNRAIRRMRGHAKIFAGLINSLMMAAVNGGRLRAI